MEYLEIVKLTSLLGSFGIGALLGGCIFYLLIKSYIPSYLAEKAKNLATKEDIEFLTDKVESVKLGYAQILEEVKSSNQLKFAAIEREKATKKEVYMEAVEAITRSQNIITSFCNLNLSDEQITASMVSDSGKIAKIQIVGTKETVKAITEYMAAVGSVTLDLMLERSRLMLRKSSIQSLTSLRERAQQEIDRYIAMIKNLNLEGNGNPDLWKTINSNVDFEQKQYDKYRDDIAELWQLQNKEHLEFTRKCMNNFFEISAILPNAVLSVRNELDMEISSDDYFNICNEHIEKGKRIFDDFLRRVEQEHIEK
jgi:hypothetical protein